MGSVAADLARLIAELPENALVSSTADHSGRDPGAAQPA